MSFVQSVILFLATLTVIGQVLSVGLIISLIVCFFSPKKKTIFHTVTNFFGQNSLPFSLIVASIATVGSLFLSEIAHFNPCKLCWYQRIFMYPVVIVAGVALFTNEKIEKFILPLAFIGFVIAAYHYLMQLFPNLLECSEETAKCSTIQFASFGYITIPLMAATAFLLIILFNVSSLVINKK